MTATATWTAPRDWNDGEFVGEDEVNEQVRDNLTYIKETAVFGMVTSGSLKLQGAVAAFATDGSGLATITFPVAFSTVIAVVPVPGTGGFSGGTVDGYAVQSQSTTGFVLYWPNNASTAGNVSYIALGT